ncbi:unnamed protein product [Brassica oleracea]
MENLSLKSLKWMNQEFSCASLELITAMLYPVTVLTLSVLCSILQPFVESLSQCPKHGLHNPFKSPERYLLYGDISTKAAHMLALPKVHITIYTFNYVTESIKLHLLNICLTILLSFSFNTRCGSWQGLLQCLVIIMVSKVMATAGLMVL